MQHKVGGNGIQEGEPADQHVSSVESESQCAPLWPSVLVHAEELLLASLALRPAVQCGERAVVHYVPLTAQQLGFCQRMALCVSLQSADE